MIVHNHSPFRMPYSHRAHIFTVFRARCITNFVFVIVSLQRSTHGQARRHRPPSIRSATSLGATCVNYRCDARVLHSCSWKGPTCASFCSCVVDGTEKRGPFPRSCGMLVSRIILWRATRIAFIRAQEVRSITYARTGTLMHGYAAHPRALMLDVVHECAHGCEVIGRRPRIVCVDIVPPTFDLVGMQRAPSFQVLAHSI